MDRRGWPWKKKSSDKIITEKPVAELDPVGASLSSVASLGDQEKYKKVNYVQISLDSYAHLTGLEDQVKTLEDQVKDLKEKLSAAYFEMNTKDSLVKQHAKVAEEAVSGWEKADAEALALKHQLESVTLSKLTAEDRASHLDGALKECTRQIRHVKEESEQKIHDVILTKTKQWDEMKLELEAKIIDLDQGLFRAAAENAALLRSLQERSNVIMQINEEKSQVEAEVELLKENIQSYEKEISSLKYELHIFSKELDIRNEEKNMSIRSEEVTNRQHLEDVKRIAKLDAECQRLRGLVRKRLPGPAALAQMKLEVESLSRDSELRLRRTAVKNPNPHVSSLPEFSIDNLQQCHKETELQLLTTRLMAMEEETQMLKEALATRNSELQASRNMCAKTVGRVKSLEAQIQALNQQRSSASNFVIPTEGFSSQNASNPPNITSISEDGIDEEGSSAESWVPLTSDLSQLRRDKSMCKPNKPENAKCLDLMNDFLEMERLACSSNDANMAFSISSNAEDKASVDTTKGGDLLHEQQPDLGPSLKEDSFNVKFSTTELEPDTEHLPLWKLQSKISMILESQTKDTDLRKVLEDIKCAMHEIQDSLPQLSVGHFSEECQPNDASHSQQSYTKDIGETVKSEISLNQGSKPHGDMNNIENQDLAAAISQIHQHVLSLVRKAIQVQGTSADGHGSSMNLEGFSASIDNFMCNKIRLADFVLELSRVLTRVSELHFGDLGSIGSGDISSSDCIEKVILLENKVLQDDLPKQTCLDGSSHISHFSSDPEVLQEGNSSLGFRPNLMPCKCSLEELEQLKLEKDNLAVELARNVQVLENTKLQLQGMEQLITELNIQLGSSERSYSLTETQLKCMTESYKSLEMRAQELEAEVNILQEKTEKLENELLEEKHSHQDALARCKDIQEQMQRIEKCSTCSSSYEADSGIKTKKEREIAAAAEKLAECQETIYILGRQLQALRPQTKVIGSQCNGRLQTNENLAEPYYSNSNEFDQAETDSAVSTDVQGASDELFSQNCNSSSSTFDIKENLSLGSSVSSSHHNQMLTKSTSSSSSSSSAAPAPEKHPRGFNRFFSSKGKNGH